MLLLALAGACRSERSADVEVGTSRQAIVADAGNVDADTEVPEAGGRIIDDGTGPKAVPNPPVKRFTGTGGYWVAQKSRPAIAPESAPAVKPRDKLLAQVAAAGPTELISTTLILKDVPAEWKSFRDATLDSERAAWISARHASLAPTRQALINWLLANGAVDVDPFWIANQIHAFIPASKVPSAIARPEVIDVAPDGTGSDSGAWTGAESTDALRLSNLAAYGMAGRGGGRLRPRVLIAIIEQSPPYREHAAFKHHTPGSARVLYVKDCTSGTSCPPTSASSTTDTHGNRVAAIAAATIEHGEDPAYPGVGTGPQKRRSGHLREAYLATYLWTQDNVSSRRGRCNRPSLMALT